MRGTNAHCVDEAQVRSSSSSSSKQRATGEWAVNKWNRTVVTLRVLPCSPQWPRPIHWSHKRTVCVRERENEWGGAFFNSNSYCSFFSDTSWAIKPPPSPLPPPFFIFSTCWFIYDHTLRSADHFPSIRFASDVHRAAVLHKKADGQMWRQICLHLIFSSPLSSHLCSPSSASAFKPLTGVFWRQPPPHHGRPPSPPQQLPLPSLIHCSYWRQDTLASMLPALTESFFFFHQDHNEIRLREIPCLCCFFRYYYFFLPQVPLIFFTHWGFLNMNYYCYYSKLGDIC